MNITALSATQLEHLREAINGDPEFQLASRDAFLNLSLGYNMGPKDPQLVFTIAAGQVVKIHPMVDRASFYYQPTDVVIKGTSEFWEKFLTAIPPANFNNCLSGLMKGHVTRCGSDELY